MCKRIIGYLAALALMLSMLPVAALAAGAAHAHPVCGSSCSDDHGDLEWTGMVRTGLGSIIGSVSKVDGTSYYIMKSGNYYLSEDIKLPYNLRVPAGVTVNLCLNGKLLTGTGKGSVITVAEGGTLNLTDCQPDTVIEGKMTSKVWVPAEGGTIVLNGGVITGGEAQSGGGIYSEGTVTMYAGNLAGNKASASSSQSHPGGGVHNLGTFTMYGGTILGNRSYNSSDSGSSVYYVGIGGGVCNEGSFLMYGGMICKNDGYHNGGGVYNAGSWEMRGGSVEQNTAYYGAGFENTGTLTLYGGSIQNNVVTYHGGGIANYGTLKIAGGTVSDNISKSSEGAGIYNTNKATVIVSGGEISGNTANSGSCAGIYISNGTLILTGGKITGNTATYSGVCSGGIYIAKLGVLQVSGSPIVSGNTANGAQSNIYLAKEGTVTVGTDTDGDGNVEYLSEGAVLPITPGTAPTEETPFVITSASGADYSRFFRADNAQYQIVNSGSGEEQVVCLELHITCVGGEPVIENEVAPDCTNSGSCDVVIFCVTCGAEISRVETVLPATGHSCGDWYTVTEATCTENGIKRQDCKNCSHHAEEPIAAQGHSYGSVITAPTCTEQGYTTHTCTACGHSYVDGYTGVLDHSYAGGTCTGCGHVLYVLGDVNADGRIDILDANLIAAYYNEITDLTEVQLLAADVNGDGKVDILDARLIVAYYNEMIDAFPEG